MNRVGTVACLAGDGVGPELMGEATRALAAVGRMHSFRVDDVHLPFGGEAVVRAGHPLPAATRAGYRDVDAILVASPHEPALEGVKADLDLAWRVVRMSDVLVCGPADESANELAVGRAFELAASRRGRVTSVGSSFTWRALVERERQRWDGMDVDHHTLGETLLRLRDPRERFDVLVTEAQLVDALADAGAHLAGSTKTVACAWLAAHGPGMFAPAAGDSADVAGMDAADPAATLLAAALMLGEGLGQRAAARTLERAVASVAARPGDTRAFTDAVISRLNDARTDTELFMEAWA
jgi:3-isopropylmalate dehydrogenase